MPGKVYSAAVVGLECEPIEVEADKHRSPNARVSIVGLPDAAVQESRDRVKSAIRNSELQFPKGVVTVNLAPADLRKEGPSYDLPIALGILDSMGTINFDPEGKIFVGELALDGKLRHVNGIISIATMVRERGYRTFFVPECDAKEAALIPDIEVMPVRTLSQLVNYFRGIEDITPIKSAGFDASDDGFINTKYDMMHVKGQEHAKRALEIAAAGAHNVLMSGPPGSGKTLMARSLSTILPKMTVDEALESTRIYSIAGMLPSDQPLMLRRPFRAPHHTSSGVSLVGGGAWPRPGEISLAHRGVLFLDELPEFDRKVLENLRQPLEDNVIQISRAQQTLVFPAKFTLVASMNPCPCGYYNSQDQDCTCSPIEVTRYQKRISGPLLDRIDIHMEVPKVKYEKLADDKLVGESSESIAKRVQKARGVQEKRFENSKITSNSEMGNEEIKKYCQVDQQSRELLKSAVNQMHLSARAYFRILKLSRTIADMNATENIQTAHIAEALQYRPKENV